MHPSSAALTDGSDNNAQYPVEAWIRPIHERVPTFE